eukprot:jgi/Ulvmu1/12753/UM095_0058.1
MRQGLSRNAEDPCVMEDGSSVVSPDAEFVEHYEDPIPEPLLDDTDPPAADDAAVDEDAWDAAAGDEGDGWQENEPGVSSDDEPSDDDDGAAGQGRATHSVSVASPTATSHMRTLTLLEG